MNSIKELDNDISPLNKDLYFRRRIYNAYNRSPLSLLKGNIMKTEDIEKIAGIVTIIGGVLGGVYYGVLIRKTVLELKASKNEI